MGAFNPLSFVTGKFSIWIIGVLVATSMSLAGWIYLLKADIKVEQAERREIENALALQSSLIEANRASYETNLETAKEQQQRVKIEYKTKVKIIEKWRDSNATCSGSIAYLNSYNF
ncbi:MAG: hypothetical protein NTW78_06070 [Campylobacterales bacterium]|nr:hypothetical protein [Campylobacterales bacterium]